MNKNEFNKQWVNATLCTEAWIFLPGNIDYVIGPPSLRTDTLEELFQRGNQHGSLTLPEEIHEHDLLLQGQVQQAQAV